MKRKVLTLLLTMLVMTVLLALSVNAECAEHDYRSEATFGNQGLLGDIEVSLICEVCDHKTTETIPSLFITRGYSYTDGGIAQGYGVDRTALERYEELTGESVKFGGVLALRSVIGEQNPLDKNGNPISSSVQTVDFTNSEYSIINLMVSGIPESMRSSEGILCALYINIGGEITYLDNRTERASCTDKTFDEVVAGPELDYVGMREYTVIDGKRYHRLTKEEFNLIHGAYWNTKTTTETGNATLNSKFWTNSVALTPETLPIGSIIEVDANNNWQYRPNKIPGTRPDNTNEKRVVVDAEWWGNYEIVGFNIGKNNGTLLAKPDNQPSVSGYTADEVMEAFKIYVPASAREELELQKPPTDYSAQKQDWDEDGVLKILAIGNSFSDDTMEYLYQVATDAGVERVVLGRLYIGGCTLAQHLANATSDSYSYTYYTNSNGSWESQEGSKSIKYAVTSDDWDFITMQQASGSSGVSSTYSTLDALIDIVEPLNPSARLVWHMTWAYQQSSTHNEFEKYNKDQMTMYNAIVEAVKKNIVTNSRIEIIAPVGTAIQNVRTSYIGDTLTRDGYHLSNVYGRYVGALAFFKGITGISVDGVDYAPSGVDATQIAVAIEATNNAYANPFEVTKSTYTTAPETPPSGGDEGGSTPSSPFGEVPEGYVALDAIDMGLMLNSFYNTEGTNTMNGTDNFSKGFVATKRFTKEELPIGSIIQVVSGWQYRPEGWNYNGSRPANVTTSEVVIDEVWWSSYTTRAFNISKTTHKNGNNDINTYSTDEIATLVFRILVPESAVSETKPLVYVSSSDCDEEIVTIDGKQYRALSIEGIGLAHRAYYFSQMTGPVLYEGGSESTRNQYYASKIFTPETLPDGSIIWVNSGWTYRPEGWVDGALNPASSRPGEVKAGSGGSMQVVDSSWWGAYTERGFNIKNNGANITDKDLEYAHNNFKIYIPVENITEEVAQ